MLSNVSEVRELYGTLREARRKNFLDISSKSKSVVPIYEQKTKIHTSISFFQLFRRWSSKLKKAT